jgi:hypothetical protein
VIPAGAPPRSPAGPPLSRIGGFDPPTASPAVREVLRGIRHTRGTALGENPATADLIAHMLDACPRNADRPAGPARCWWQPPT